MKVNVSGSLTEPGCAMSGRVQQPFVRLVDVSKGYWRGGQQIPVLRDVNLEIAEGEFVAVMGPSGSGKSTLLNLLGGLDRPDKGEIWIDGERLDLLSERELTRWRAKHVGFVFQTFNLLPCLSAERNVELPLLLTRLSSVGRRRRVELALSLVGLLHRRRHYPSQLSGGEQQRVAIARAIVASPKLLLCDEPTGELDRQSADQILDLLSLLNHRFGRTIVMVTHDPHASARAQRCIYLYKGEIVDAIPV